MTKVQFMTILSNGIASLTILERQEILSDYEEHFRQGATNGMTEREICDSLGDPASIARDYLDEAAQRPRVVPTPNVNLNKDDAQQQAPPYAGYQVPPNAGQQGTYGQQNWQNAGPQPRPMPPPRQGNSAGTQFILTLLLIFVNLIFVIPILLGVFVALIGCFGAGIAIIVAGILVIAALIHGYIYAVAGLAVLCLGLLVCIGMGALIGLFFKGIGAYARWNVRAVKGGNA